MWKIGLGYLLLLIWCYTRAELHRRQVAQTAVPCPPPAPGPTAPSLRITSCFLLLAAAALVVWGSGWNFILWLPAGFILTGLVQTLLPLRNDWR